MALFGGFLLTGALTTQQGDELAPAASTDSALPEETDQGLVSPRGVDFSGTFPTLGIKEPGEMTLLASGFLVTGDTVEGEFTDLDDPRLNGSVRYVINRIGHFDGAGDVASYVARIDNEGGSWLGTGYGYHGGSGSAQVGYQVDLRDWLDTTTYRGTGAYEGLSAIMVGLPTDDGFSVRVIGMVFPGEIPEMPEIHRVRNEDG